MSDSRHKRTQSADKQQLQQHKKDDSPLLEEPRQSRASRFQWFRRSLGPRSSSSDDLSSRDHQSAALQSSVKEKIKGFRSGLEAMMDKLLRDSAHGIDFLAKLKKGTAQDVADQLKKFITKFEAEGDTMSPKEQSRAVQSFYEDLSERLMTSPLFAHLSDDHLETIQSGAERHVMHHIYDTVFSRDPDEGAQDMALQTRVRQLRWVRPHHLDACIDLNNEEVVSELENAQEELITIDAKRAPQDKLECVVACAKSVFLILSKSASSQQAASADDFVPALIYTLIQANPPQLISNIKFIQNFGNPQQHESGEAGYYFTNLLGAASFVQRLTAANLKMTQQQFESLMDGDASSATEGLKSMQIMRDSLDRLRRLENKQRVLQREVDMLFDTLSELCASAVKPLRTGADVDVTPYTQTLLTRDSADGKRARRAVSSPASPFSCRKWSDNAEPGSGGGVTREGRCAAGKGVTAAAAKSAAVMEEEEEELEDGSKRARGEGDSVSVGGEDAAQSEQQLEGGEAKGEEGAEREKGEEHQKEPKEAQGVSTKATTPDRQVEQGGQPEHIGVVHDNESGDQLEPPKEAQQAGKED